MAPDPLKYFRIESRELAQGLGKELLALEKEPGSLDTVTKLLRLAHTLKGAARVVKQREIADLAHSIEDALVPLRAGEGVFTREVMERTLKYVDAISAQVDEISKPARVEEPAANEPAQPATPAQRQPSQPATHAATADDTAALAESVMQLGVELGSVREGLEVFERVRRIARTLSEQVAMTSSPIRGPVAQVRARSLAEDLSRALTSLEDDLAMTLERCDREQKQVRETTERMRLLPVSTLINALERATRDASVALGKPVTFSARDTRLRLDASTLGPMQGALVQAIRNAVAHGIESQKERIAAGKPAEGRVTVEVERRGHQVVFRCQDDGRGIDRKAVRDVAERYGLVSSGQAELNNDQLMELLLRGGISTSSAVTEVSGRGVGLDVVRAAAAQLGGTVTLRSEPGIGTTVEMSVPATLGSLDVLLVEVRGASVAIPMSAVQCTVRLSADSLRRSANGDSMVDQDQVIPFAPLGRVLQRGHQAAQELTACSAILIKSGSKRVAAGVDRLIGIQHAVLRPLPALTPASSVVTGIVLDERGRPCMVLDADEVVSLLHAPNRSQAKTPVERAPVLIIDDSMTTRMLEQSILESAGYEVDTACSAEEGLEKARLREYGLFLVDVEMPGIDGFTFVERTRADPQLRRTPAFLVTSRNAPEDKARGFAAGAMEYIVKSEFDQAALLTRLREVVG